MRQQSTDSLRAANRVCLQPASLSSLTTHFIKKSHTPWHVGARSVENPNFQNRHLLKIFTSPGFCTLGKSVPRRNYVHVPPKKNITAKCHLTIYAEVATQRRLLLTALVGGSFCLTKEKPHTIVGRRLASAIKPVLDSLVKASGTAAKATKEADEGRLQVRSKSEPCFLNSFFGTARICASAQGVWRCDRQIPACGPFWVLPLCNKEGSNKIVNFF